jgi:hypothetical protein
MAQNLLTSPELLKAAAFRKKNPEFAAAVRELELAHMYADRMLAAGRLTQEEADHFEAHLYGKFIEALPVDEFQELMKNGGMDHLQSLAGHDGTRDAGDVEDTRKLIEAKIKAEALDEAWLEGRIDSKYYAEQSQKIEKYQDEELDKRIADEDYDGAAREYFISRNDVPSHERDLVKFFKDKYGENPSASKPPGYVDHETVIDAPYSMTNNPNRSERSDDGYIDHDASDEEDEQSLTAQAQDNELHKYLRMRYPGMRRPT